MDGLLDNFLYEGSQNSDCLVTFFYSKFQSNLQVFQVFQYLSDSNKLLWYIFSFIFVSYSYKPWRERKICNRPCEYERGDFQNQLLETYRMRKKWCQESHGLNNRENKLALHYFIRHYYFIFKNEATELSRCFAGKKKKKEKKNSQEKPREGYIFLPARRRVSARSSCEKKIK